MKSFVVESTIMTQKSFTVSGWSGGASGLGFRISARQRALHFPKEIKIITLHLPRLSDPIIVDLSNKHGFWNKCPELMNKHTKNWLIENGYERGGKNWSHGNPPKFTLTQINQGEFRITEEGEETNHESEIYSSSQSR